MQTISFKNHTPTMVGFQKSKNQFSHSRRDWMKCKKIWAAVREWESIVPGQAQERIAQLVAEEWARADGRGIAVNKQNLFRYLKNEGGSEKYTTYVMQLSGSIIAAMPVQIARKHGLSNASTEAELVASAIKECSEAHQAKLVGAPLQKLEKEIREAAIALFNMLPADAAGPLLASISAVAPQLF
ncbi:toxin YdaT family protein [Citrobacter freundii]|uniref:toxin YdaT family protein n=1 Tax=Citrobacter freundii TaxID=546 RepID=UPI0023AF88EA|nr:toxin YdaT family protein [Citrobacter freundii]MDE8814590.1 toxin YdaT family protein [Citrobacter freundii]MDV2277218.1 toxin YdaT family protein [Citrobacter freundii]MEB0857410.1 toxin YdaT family protein [Citrobacter freundii]